MNLIQPWALWFLPLAALPIVIHLVNQRRFQTVDWAAMHFLLAANQMNRGFAKLRQWAILAARTAAVLALILAITRPLSDGWLGLAAGNRVDTTIVLLDRSPSMSASNASGRTKLETGVDRLVDTLEKLDSNRFVLIDSRSGTPIEFDNPADLKALPQAVASAASVDIPEMLQATADYVRDNRPGRVEVWICSDIQQTDWDASDGRWSAIRTAFARSPQSIRFHLLAYTDPPQQNRSIRVTNVRRIDTGQTPQLLLSLNVKTPGRARSPQNEDDPSTTGRADTVSFQTGTRRVPILLTVDGARSEFDIELRDGQAELRDHVIPLSPNQIRGWGSVQLPADRNLADNVFYFAFDSPIERQTLIVTDEVDTARPLIIASSISPEASITCTAQVVTPAQFASTAIDQTALILWHADLPTGDDAELMEWFVERGGKAIFFPPAEPSTSARFAGLRWDRWNDSPAGLPVSTWTGDQDLLGNVRSGAALPVGTLKVQRHCQLDGDAMTLAMLDGGKPLLARAVTPGRNLYFCTTTVAPGDSSLARDGVVLYAMIQRAVSDGAASLGAIRRLNAGTAVPEAAQQWRRIDGTGDPLSVAFTEHAGVYQSRTAETRSGDSATRWFTVNRSAPEDSVQVVPPEKVESLFAGLDFSRVDDQVGSDVSLVQEIWQLLLWTMMLALLLEAILSIPRRSSASLAASPGRRTIDRSGFDNNTTPTPPSQKPDGVVA